MVDSNYEFLKAISKRNYVSLKDFSKVEGSELEIVDIVNAKCFVERSVNFCYVN